MARTGRKPFATRHVDRLSGSQLAKQRMRAILKTLRGEWTIPEACRQLGVCESRFHALRQQWLQESLELLEPRPVGRPPKATAESSPETQAEVEVEQLRQQLHLADVRREIDQVLSSAAGEEKKPQRKAR